MNARLGLKQRRVLVLAGVAASLIACGEGSAPGVHATVPMLVGHPDLEQFEPGVVAMLGDEIARFESAMAAPEADDADRAEAAGRLGMIYHAHHLTDAAASAYATAAALAPDEFRWPYYRGVLLADAGQPAEARAALALAGALRPDDVPTRLWTGRVLLAFGQADEARAVFESVAKTQPDNAVALAGIGSAAMMSGDGAAAVVAYTAALDAQPGATKLHHPLALAYRALGDTATASRHLALRGDSEPAFVDPLLAELDGLSRSAQYYLARGRQALQAGNPAEAAEDFRRAVEFNPGDVVARATYARMLQDLGRTSAALREIKVALTIDPTHAVANYFKGALDERLGDDRAAIAHYGAALATDPGYVEPRMLLANALMRARRYADAAGHYEVLAAALPRNVRVRHFLGLALMASGRCSQATAPLEAAREINAGYGPVLIALARRDASCGDASDERIARAVELGTALFDARPDYETAATLAMAQAAAGHFNAAIQTQQHAQRLAQSDDVPETMTGIDANLDRYRRHQSAAKPWPEASSAYFPPPLHR